MSKGQSSTCSDSSTIVGCNANEAQLMQLVKNLQLELGFHVMALKKAQKMIQLLQKDNKCLNAQNSMLKSKCKELQLKIVKYDNHLSNISQASSTQYIECFSAGLKNTKPLGRPPFRNLDVISQNQDISPGRKSHKKVNETETALKQKSNRLTKSNRLNIPAFQIQFEQNQQKTTSPLKNMKRSYQRSSYGFENSSNCIQGAKSLSFIPFQQLQLKTKYN